MTTAPKDYSHLTERLVGTDDDPEDASDRELRRAYRALSDLDPRLTLLEREVLAMRRPALRQHRFCANEQWFPPNGFKARMSKLLGWGRKRGPKPMRSSDAYDIGYQWLYYRCLPDCRRCGCDPR